MQIGVAYSSRRRLYGLATGGLYDMHAEPPPLSETLPSVYNFKSNEPSASKACNAD